MNLGSLFSGVAGIELGFESGGLREWINKNAELYGLLNQKSTQNKYFKKDSPMPKYMQTLRKLILAQFIRLTDSVEDSHAKTFQTLVRKLALRGVALHSGNITSKRLGYYDQDLHLLKTYQQSLVEDSTLSLQILPQSGMMQNGIVYRLPQLVRGTKEEGFSLLPTPTCMDSIHSDKMEGEFKITKNNTFRQYHPKGYNRPLNLSRMAAWNMFPTPTKRDYKGGRRPETLKLVGRTENNSLPDKVGGQLNPDWIEWLMGFPIGWTGLSVSETQSYRKLRKSLQKQSKKHTKNTKKTEVEDDM